MLFSEIPASITRIFVTCLGLLVGSFLNVVIYRLPREMSVVTPGSHCPGCNKPIRAWQNIPILSYLLLRGKSACCGTPISVRYPLVELMGGVLALAIFEVVRRGMAPDETMAHWAVVYFTHFILVMGLLAAMFIDFEHMILPDSITLGGTVLAMATATTRGLGWQAAGIGALVGFGIVYFPFILGYRLLRGRPGMGMGDAKLLLLAGAWFGAGGALYSIFAGAIQGVLGAAIIFLVKGKIEEPQSVQDDRAALQKMADEGDAEAQEALDEDPVGSEPEEGFGKARIAFGPFIILGCFEYLFAGPTLLRWFEVWVDASPSSL